MNIPLVDLKRQYLEIKEAAQQAVCSVLEGGHYISGKNVAALEREFAGYVGVRYGIAVANGTDALTIALRSLGVGEGDEVITTPFTFFATGEAISALGARPVFVDVREDTFNLDETLVERAITSRTQAIVPVHLFGQCAQMEEIIRIAGEHKLGVVEDACQAAGASYQGQMAGSFGDLACFSFFPTKNLAGAGDGGMICTDRESLAVICRGIASHGRGEIGRKAAKLLYQRGDEGESEGGKYCHYLIGQNSRLDEIQAALIRVKLGTLESSIRRRREAAAFYRQVLPSWIGIPREAQGNRHGYHLYCVSVENREAVAEHLRLLGVETGVYYPVPLHLQPCYRQLGYQKGDFPVAEKLARTLLALPLFPGITKEELAIVARGLQECK